jgi:predicted transcriptional regulator
VGSWSQKSGELADFSFLINKDIRIDELKKVGSWEEKSGELLKKRGRVLLATLLLSILPISLEELGKILGYKSKERYRDDYVKSLKDNGLIQYTLEQANDPNQQYQLTQRGINFLMGSPI